MDLSVKLGDTAPLPRYQLLDSSGQPANLTGATVVQRFKGAPADGSPCEIDGDPADGIVRLASRDDLPAISGGGYASILFETEARYADGTIQSFPTRGFDNCEIWSDLDA